MLRGAICATQVEAELQELEEEEALEYLQSLGVEEGGLRSLIAATYKQLGLLTYFTTGRGTCLSACCCIVLARAHICADADLVVTSLSVTLPQREPESIFDLSCLCVLLVCL